MQKLADGQDTDVGSSPPWLWSRCVAAPQAGAALDCAVAGRPPAGGVAPCPGGADDPLHPVAAPISRMDTQANASRSRPVMLSRLVGDVPVKPAGRGFQRPITASVYSDDSRAMRVAGDLATFLLLDGILWLRSRPKSFRDHAAFHDHGRKVSYTHTFLP
jgi:hypothetical protein